MLPDVTYEPGIAARLVSLAVARIGEKGTLTASKTTYDTRIKAFTEQIERFESRLVAREANMRRQWTAVQTLLSSLQNQGDWLSSQAAAANKQVVTSPPHTGPTSHEQSRRQLLDGSDPFRTVDDATLPYGSRHTMTNSQSLRERFTSGTLDTASGPRVVVMAYERLDRDIAGALSALADGDLAKAHELLCHAQDLVHELNGMLDVDAWEHGPSLAAIYRYVIVRLTEANMTKLAAPATEARNLLAELGDAFRTASARLPPRSLPQRFQRCWSKAPTVVCRCARDDRGRAPTRRGHVRSDRRAASGATPSMPTRRRSTPSAPTWTRWRAVLPTHNRRLRSWSRHGLPPAPDAVRGIDRRPACARRWPSSPSTRISPTGSHRRVRTASSTAARRPRSPCSIARCEATMTTVVLTVFLAAGIIVSCINVATILSGNGWRRPRWMRTEPEPTLVRTPEAVVAVARARAAAAATAQRVPIVQREQIALPAGPSLNARQIRPPRRAVSRSIRCATSWTTSSPTTPISWRRSSPTGSTRRPTGSTPAGTTAAP